MKKTTLATLISVSFIALTGCSTQGALTPSVDAKEMAEIAQQRTVRPVSIAPVSRVQESMDTFIPVTTRKVSENVWLRDIKVKLQLSSASLTMAEVMRVLARQGVNITSEIPLDKFYYTGFSINDTDAETALRMILSSAGLDYTADNTKKLVIVKAMGSKTWFINTGNRKVTYATGNPTSSGSSSTSSGSSNGLNASSGVVAATASGTSTISSNDDFWKSLETELNNRLKISLPNISKKSVAPPVQNSAVPAIPVSPVPSNAPPIAATALPPLPVPGSAPQASTANVDETGAMDSQIKTVGTFSLNPETGSVTVQAPHWMLSELDSYFKRVQDMYNTDITFQGELILLSTDNTKSEGLDISAFARFAKGRYNVGYQNNALGGVTVNIPADGVKGVIAAGANALSGPLVGVSSALDGLQIFNAYLSNLGRINTLQKPVLTTTSGVPADFKRTITRYFNTISQEAASGGSGGSAATATKNVLISQDFGTILRVNPRIDVSTGLIRAQIELVQTTQAGLQSIPQTITSGNNIQQITTQLPIVSKIVYSGEALLRDGDLVVMGGQTEDINNANREGITNLMDNSVVGGVFGKTTKTTERSVFYFALKVSVSKR